MKQYITINGRESLLFECNEQPQVLLIQPLGEHERSTIDNEVAHISEAVKVPFVMAALAISDWEAELTPWHDPKLSTRKDVGDHVFETLDYITGRLMPYLFEQFGKLPVVLGGYSLAGLFARWAVSKVECFDAVAAASPSLWIVAWCGFSDAHDVSARYVYLSLGEREEFAKNKAIAQVGNNVRWEYDHLQRTIGADNCTLEWNPGNHFQDNDKRLAKAFAWCINKLTISSKS